MNWEPTRWVFVITWEIVYHRFLALPPPSTNSKSITLTWWKNWLVFICTYLRLDVMYEWVYKVIWSFEYLLCRKLRIRMPKWVLSIHHRKSNPTHLNSQTFIDLYFIRYESFPLIEGINVELLLLRFYIYLF